MLRNEIIDRLTAAVDENDENTLKNCCSECCAYMKTLCIPVRDRFIDRVLIILRENVTSIACNKAFEYFKFECGKNLGLFRFFYAMFPEEKNISNYIRHYNSVRENLRSDEIAVTVNAFVMEYGLAAFPDLILMSMENPDTKLYSLIEGNLRSAWNYVTSDLKFEGIDNHRDDSALYKLSIGYLSEAFAQYGIRPKFLRESPSVDIVGMVESDIQMIIESTSDSDEMSNKLMRYQEAYVDGGAIYHIMANMMQEAAYGVESYIWFADMFESEYDRCEREGNYLQMCEAQYRATGKRPRYISNTYDLDDDPPAKKKDDDWINPPDDEKPSSKKEKEEDDYLPPVKKKIKPFDFDDDDKADKKSSDSGAKNVYNITYQNSFNRNRRSTVKDSYNRTNSDDIYSNGRSYDEDGDDVSSDLLIRWRNRSKIQKKIRKSFESKRAMTNQPEDLKSAYLKDLMWNDENVKNVAPWVIMRDTQRNRPHDDVEYRKYLANKIEQLANDRDIEYDGSVIVAGDTIDGIYDIELSRYNEKHIVDSLRKVANAVLKYEDALLSKSKEKPVDNKTLAEAIELFNQMDSFEEAIKGGDPTKDRPLGQRINNRLEDFNAKAQHGAANLDRGMRTTAEIGRSLARTPATFIRTVKNFISDLQNRGEQNLKEDLLKDKKLRLRIYGFMRSLINTGLPWVVLGPLWGTLFNIVAIPIRMIKGTFTALRGGPHRDMLIELREELSVELEIVQDMINKAEAAGDTNKKYKLMREKSRMEQEYLKIASKVHFDPEANKRARRGESPY